LIRALGEETGNPIMAFHFKLGERRWPGRRGRNRYSSFFLFKKGTRIAARSGIGPTVT